MIAIPVDSDNAHNGVISEKFGHVDYFALFTPRGELSGIIHNEAKGRGRDVSALLARHGVRQVVFCHLGDKLFGWLSRENIASYAVTEPGMSIDQGLDRLRERRLELVTDANVGRLLHPSGHPGGIICDCKVVETGANN